MATKKKIYRSDYPLDDKVVEKSKDLSLNRYPQDMEIDLNPPDLSMPDGGKYGTRGEVKGLKAAILASLLLGENPAKLAKQYDLSPQLIRNWENEFDITSPISRRDQLSEHLLIFIGQEIKNLIAIGIITSDESWVKWQNASDLSSFLQVKGALIMQLLTAFGKASQQAAELRQRLEDKEEDDD